MSVGSELLRVLINIVILLVAAGMLYEFINWFIRNMFLPITDLNRELNNVPELLTKFAQAYSATGKPNRQNLSTVSNQIKVLASRIIGGRDTIPVYDFLSKLGIVHNREVIDDIVRSLNFLAAALFETNSSQSTIDIVQQKIIKLEESLGIAKLSARRIKVEQSAPETLPEEEAEPENQV